MTDFFRGLAESVKDADTSIVADGLGAAEFEGYVDTGCYMLNAVLSGSLYGGLASNKITGLAGENSTGKTFIALGMVKNFLDADPQSGVIYYDTEAAITKKMMAERGIDVSRVILAEPDTVQKFRHHAIKLVDKYIETPKAKRPKMLMVLDSLGMLSTTKEVEDTTEGKETKDMTRSQIIKAAFRILTLKLARAGIPMVCTNHVYAAMGSMYPTNEVAGGSGLKYSASSIAVLGKAKDKDGTEVVGNFIRVKMLKSRLSKENSEVRLRLSYKTGLDRFYGLLDLAEEFKIFKKVSTRFELPDGRKVFGKEINDNPEKYYTPEIMARLEEAAHRKFSYGDDDDGEADSHFNLDDGDDENVREVQPDGGVVG